MLTAAQALDYRLPLRPGRGIEAAHRLVRNRIPHREADYLFQEDLAKAFSLIRGRELLEAAGMGWFTRAYRVQQKAEPTVL
jgi:histidine ammonia-lyase